MQPSFERLNWRSRANVPSLPYDATITDFRDKVMQITQGEYILLTLKVLEGNIWI